MAAATGHGKEMTHSPLPIVDKAELLANLHAPIEEKSVGLCNRAALKQQKIALCHIAGMTKLLLSSPSSTLCQQRACGDCLHTAERA